MPIEINFPLENNLALEAHIQNENQEVADIDPLAIEIDFQEENDSTFRRQGNNQVAEINPIVIDDSDEETEAEEGNYLILFPKNNPIIWKVNFIAYKYIYFSIFNIIYIQYLKNTI